MYTCPHCCGQSQPPGRAPRFTLPIYSRPTMRRSSRLSTANPPEQLKPAKPEGDAREPKSKRPRRSAPAQSPAANVALPAKATASPDTQAASTLKREDGPSTEDAPSAYELERLENMKRNAMVMASLGLSEETGGMRAAVKSDAAQRAKSRGLAPRTPKVYPARSRYSTAAVSIVNMKGRCI